jgi:leucyl aminopeptidase
LQIVEFDRGKIEAVKAGAERGRLIAESVCFARDLANEPGVSLPPRTLAERARTLAQEFALECQVLTEKELEAEGMAGILGVARGSEEPPRLIVLQHRPQKKAESPTVLVGKGVTFDSGGISIKPREGMEAMKYDMSGAAAVLGAMRAVALLKLPLHVVGLVPAVENLPSGKALKPGDILRYSNGKTVEVTNTDAEGRLILADALLYAERFKPRAVIDLATLTGACVVALGKEAAGLFCNDSELLEKLQRASQRSGERLWELPLYEEYKRLLKSEVADIGNSVLARGSTPQAGASAGAVFLKEFVTYPWAHLDIAGTANDMETRVYCPKGATGFGVRLLMEFLLNEALQPNV